MLNNLRPTIFCEDNQRQPPLAVQRILSIFLSHTHILSPWGMKQPLYKGIYLEYDIFLNSVQKSCSYSVGNFWDKRHLGEQPLFLITQSKVSGDQGKMDPIMTTFWDCFPLVPVLHSFLSPNPNLQANPPSTFGSSSVPVLYFL